MRVSSLLLAAVLMSSSAAFAEEDKSKSRDMSKMTCSEFLELGAPDAVVTLFWFDGFLNKDTAVWDSESFGEHRDKIVTICSEEDGADKLVMTEIQDLD